MLQGLSKEIRDCYARAEACARKAEQSFSEEMRADFLRLEQSWLTLARSYEFAVRLLDFTRHAKQQSESWHHAEKARAERERRRTTYFFDELEPAEPVRRKSTRNGDGR